ncbi:arginase family protein [Candidatus Woesearchaeota archaeon]|nr:arginase family protein [Candidatus Woesearchaeota archaeon]
MKFAYNNVSKLSSAQYVLLGVPDERGSHAMRKGSSLAPTRIRRVSCLRSTFYRQKKTSIVQSSDKLLKMSLFDAGNIKKSEVSSKVDLILRKNKFPIILGGDHSITVEILRGFQHHFKRLAFIYFDAHPDFVCSTRKYYGSVVCDISDFPYIDLSRSLEIGVREPEAEELRALRTRHLFSINPYHYPIQDVEKTFSIIKKRVGGIPVYISLDMDVVDPAFAPGVSTPVPGGISSITLLSLLRRIATLRIVGFDIVEVCPTYDIQNMTSHLAVKSIVEFLGTAK